MPHFPVEVQRNSHNEKGEEDHGPMNFTIALGRAETKDGLTIDLNPGLGGGIYFFVDGPAGGRSYRIPYSQLGDIIADLYREDTKGAT